MSRIDDKKDMGTSFRKLDVDEYNENNFKEEEGDGGLVGSTGPDENEILNLLSQYPLQILNNLFNILTVKKFFFFSFSLINKYR